MKATLISFLAVLCGLSVSCEKKPQAMVITEVIYSHPDATDMGVTMTRRQEVGTITTKTPSSGQSLSLKNERELRFHQATDASNPDKIRVTVGSTMDGFPSEEQTLEFSTTVPNPPTAVFKNGLKASVRVNTTPLPR